MRAWRRTRRLALYCLSLENFRSQVNSWPLPPPQTSSQKGRQQPDPRDPPSCCLFSSLRSNLPPELARLPAAIRESGCSFNLSSSLRHVPCAFFIYVIRIVERWSLISSVPCSLFLRSRLILLFIEGKVLNYGSDISRCILSYSLKGCQRKLTRWYQSVWLLCLLSGVSKPGRKKMKFHVLQH